MAGGSQNDDEMIASINVTPLVDITLVLLIIFMVTAKIIVSQSIPLDLPKAQTSGDQQVVFAVTIDKEGHVLADKRPMTSDDELKNAAKDAMAQIIINSRMAAEGHRPICQDTGICIAFIRVGMDARFEGPLTPEQMVNEGVRRAYTDVNNPLRGSMLLDPDGTRKNTGDNTPGVTHIEIVPGDKVDVIVAAKGGGSENKSKFAMLLPSDNIIDWVLSMVPIMGADWCPPGLLSLGRPLTRCCSFL